MDSISGRIQHVVDAVLDKKALNLDVLLVEKLTSIADYFILCSGTSERQTQAIADAVEAELRDESVRPRLVEGMNPGRWILLDYGDFIVHVFTEECRRFYGLERLWGDAPNVTEEFVRVSESRPNERQR